MELILNMQNAIWYPLPQHHPKFPLNPNRLTNKGKQKKKEFWSLGKSYKLLII